MSAPLMPMYQYRTSPGRHWIHVDPPLSLSDGASKESVMQRVIDRFQQFIRECPDQWYAFRPMFKS
jgi:lauroyl/myristoyl acyltransferase